MNVVETQQDSAQMRRALGLAEGGRGRVSPNPLVGAVIARDGDVIGEAFHAELGGLHGERAAIEDCRERGNDPSGATLYVTLEPCAHTGRQPPCVDGILEAGIARVLIGTDDPSEKAAGRGPAALRDAGVEVEYADGAEAAAARLLVQPFRKHARTGRPLVTYKVATTVDGRVAIPGGGWFTGPESRELVHRWRAEADAVAVGIETALTDDPLLTAREVEAFEQPARVVFDSKGRLSLGSNLVGSIGEAPLVVVTGPDAPAERVQGLTAAGAEVIPASGVAEALEELGRRDITNLFLEGGPTLASAFLDVGEIDELRLFIAPGVIGGGDAPGPFSGAAVGEAIQPLAVEHDSIGSDLLLRVRMREW